MPQLPQSLTIYRQEIIDIQKSRVDLMKWKLILIGGLGGFGLEKAPTILILIPFICVYVDALCYQQSLKIFVISRFICDVRQRNMQMDVNYEKLCNSLSNSFSLEDVALVWSSVVLSILTSVGYYFAPDNMNKGLPNSAVIACSVIGVIASIFVISLYYERAMDLGRKLKFSWASWLPLVGASTAFRSNSSYEKLYAASLDAATSLGYTVTSFKKADGLIVAKQVSSGSRGRARLRLGVCISEEADERILRANLRGSHGMRGDQSYRVY